MPRGFGFLQRHRHDNAFPGGQAVGFDNDRRAFLAQVSQRRFDFGEVLVLRRRDLMARKKIFGEGFRAFQLRGAFGWAEDFQTGGAESVNHTNHQRRFRTNDGQINLLVLGKAQQRRNIRYADGHVLQRGFQRGARVARGDKYRFDFRRLCRFPRQGVLAPAVANH